MDCFIDPFDRPGDGTYPALSLADARTAAVEAIAKAQTGGDPVAERRDKEARCREDRPGLGGAAREAQQPKLAVPGAPA